jgi:hypothetical protein
MKTLRSLLGVLLLAGLCLTPCAAPAAAQIGLSIHTTPILQSGLARLPRFLDGRLALARRAKGLNRALALQYIGFSA